MAGVRILAADPGSAVLPSTSTHGRLVRLFRGRTPATVMRSSLSVPIPAATSGSLSTSPSDDLRTPSREESTPSMLSCVVVGLLFLLFYCFIVLLLFCCRCCTIDSESARFANTRAVELGGVGGCGGRRA